MGLINWYNRRSEGLARPSNWTQSNFRDARRREAEPSTLVLLGLALIIFIVDFFWGFNAIDFNWYLEAGWRMWASFPISTVVAIVAVLTLASKENNAKTVFSRFFLYGVMLLILNLNGFRNFTGMIHLAIPYLMYWLWARGTTDEASANMTFGALWIIDYVGYGFFLTYTGNQLWSDAKLLSMLSNRLILHVWGLYAIFSSYKYDKDGISQILVILLVLSMVFYLTDNGTALTARMSNAPQLRNGWYEYATTGVKKGIEAGKQLISGFDEYKEAQLEYATGGYYKSEVEKNEEEPLGVYIENVQSAQDKYYQDEPIVIWADLRAKTLNDPISIKMNCSTGEDDDIKVGELKPDYYAGSPINFNITAEASESIQCRFGKANGLEPATHTINIEAEFNFETISYLKTYFMDIERIRALKRSNIDPLDEYGITDKSPTAKYTNGPIRIGMGTNTDLPIGLGTEYIQSPRLGITIENQWNGKIKNISNLIIQIPKSMELEYHEKEDVYCNGWFEPTDYSEIDEDLQDDGYKTYMITEEGRKTIKFPIETFESIRCLIEIDKANVEDVLGITPLATHYYRVYVTYNYYIESSVSVSIIDDPNKPTEMTSCTDQCNDRNGCICVNPKCQSYSRENEKGEKFTIPWKANCGGPITSTGSSTGSSLAPTDLSIKIVDKEGNEITTTTEKNGKTVPATYDRNVKLKLSGKNIHSCQYWNYGTTPPNVWELFEEEKSWELSEGYGTKKVYYQCKSVDENENEQLSPDNIFDEIEYAEAQT